MSLLKTQPLTDLLTAELTAGYHGVSGEKFTTVRELARRFNISPVTAQRVVSLLCRQGLLVRSGRRMKIGNLAPQKKIRIGVAVTLMDNPFFYRLLNEIEWEGARRGIEIISAGSFNLVPREQQLLNMFVHSEVDGALICPAHDYKSADALKNFPLPFVLIGHRVSGVNAPCIEVDNFRAGELAAEHLISCGCREFIYISNSVFVNDERGAGFSNALNDYGFQLTPERIFRLNLDSNLEILPEMLKKLYRGKKIGVFCYHDLWALRTIRAANFCRLSVPRDIAILGMDDLPIAQETLPALSSIAYPMAMIASGALDLFNSIHSTNNQQNRHILLEPNVIVRSSTYQKEVSWLSHKPQ